MAGEGEGEAGTPEEQAAAGDKPAGKEEKDAQG
jgi:hypothetical protein